MSSTVIRNWCFWWTNKQQDLLFLQSKNFNNQALWHPQWQSSTMW